MHRKVIDGSRWNLKPAVTLAEFIHALEDSFGLMFDEDAVEAAIDAARRHEKSEEGASATKAEGR